MRKGIFFGIGMLVFLGSWVSQEQYSLAPFSPKKGDQERVSLQGSLSIDLSVEVFQGENQLDKSSFSGRGDVRLQFLREVTDAVGDLLTSTYTVEEFTSMVEGERRKGSEAGERVQLRPLGSLAGSRLALQVKDEDIVSLRVLSGNVEEKDLQTLRRYLQVPQFRFLPTRSVRVGESWRVEGKELYGLLRDVSDEEGKVEPKQVEGALVGRLERVVDGWAYLSFTGTATIEYEVVRESPLARAKAKVTVDGSRWQVNVINPSEARANLTLFYDIEARTLEGEISTHARTQLKANYTLEVKSIRS